MIMKYDNPESFDIDTFFAKLLKVVNLDPRDAGGAIVFTGSDPVLPSKHRLGTVMAFGMMGAAAATQIFYKTSRGGPSQDLSVDVRAAAAHINPLVAFKPSIGRDGYQLLFADPRVNPISFGMFQTKDNRGYFPTGAYPHRVPDWLRLLECLLNRQRAS